MEDNSKLNAVIDCLDKCYVKYSCISPDTIRIVYDEDKYMELSTKPYGILIAVINVGKFRYVYDVDSVYEHSEHENLIVIMRCGEYTIRIYNGIDTKVELIQTLIKK